MRIAATIVTSAVAVAALAAASPEEPRKPAVRKVGPHRYRVGTVLLDARQRTVSCPGEVNMDSGGPIELLACTPRGKTHESVLVLNVAPMDLQLALLLLDLQDGHNPAVEFPEDDPPQEPPGDLAEIHVEWTADQKSEDPVLHRRRGEEFLYNVQADTPAKRADWVFLGSRTWRGRFGAEVEGSLISTYHDPLAILELNLATVNRDIYYDVNREVCPPRGTAVELIVHPLPRPDAEADPEPPR